MKLLDFQRYYNGHRTHAGLNGRTPEPRPETSRTREGDGADPGKSGRGLEARAGAGRGHVTANNAQLVPQDATCVSVGPKIPRRRS